MRTYKPIVTVDSMSDDELYESTRFPRSAVQDLCEMLSDELKRPTYRSHALTAEAQIVAALQFYSSGSFQWMVGRGTGMSQSSISRSVENVTDALCKLSNSYITFPSSDHALLNTKLAFNNIAAFPNVLGAIDCTHVAIKAPKQDEDAYVNRKGVHTINVQAVCDADMKLLNVVARWPGSTHDSFIWRTSNLHHLFDHGYIQGGWLLGITFIVYAIVYNKCILISYTNTHPHID